MVLAMLVSPAGATVLNFNTGDTSSNLNSYNAGDGYGSAAGAGVASFDTANVDVDWQDFTGYQSHLRWINGGAAPPTNSNVGWFPRTDGAQGSPDVIFTPDPGYEVRLMSIDLINGNGGGNRGTLMQMKFGAGPYQNVYFDTIPYQSSVTENLDTDAVNQWSSDPVHLYFEFYDGSLGISGLYIDNLVFQQRAIPEPASLSLLGLGALATLRRRRA